MQLAAFCEMGSNPTSKKTITKWANELGYSERNLIRRIREETANSSSVLRMATVNVLNEKDLANRLTSVVERSQLQNAPYYKVKNK